MFPLSYSGALCERETKNCLLAPQKLEVDSLLFFHDVTKCSVETLLTLKAYILAGL